MTRILKVRREDPAPWLNGEVKRHCIDCESVVDRMDRVCPVCSAPLRKECPTCHYWVEMDSDLLCFMQTRLSIAVSGEGYGKDVA